MGKRILFSLSLIIICFCSVSAQSEANPTTKSFPSKPVTVVTPKGATTPKSVTQTPPSVKTTTKTTVNTKPPVVAGKGLTEAKTAKTTTTAAEKTTAKTAKAAPVKAKTTVSTKKSKAKATTKTAAKTTVKAKTPTAVTTTKAKTATPATTVQTKSVPTQYAVNAVKTAPKAAVLTTPAAAPMSFSKEMLAAVNALRKTGTTCGSEKMPPVKPLVWSAQLESAAVVHVADMDEHDHFSHAGTDGTLPDDRIKTAGYEWARVGENIGQGYKDVSAAIKGWKASTNHCKQMMSADIINIGAAKKGKYWCQTFASPIE
jgi:uncharacterized protein YkwD